jgi:hypothetical protein
VGEQGLPQWPGALSEAALQHGVLRPSFGCLDAYRWVSQVVQVVRAGPHVRGPDVSGQRETVSDELTAHQRRQLVRVLIEVHIRVQAPRLVQLHLGLPGELEQVARAGGWGEEAVGVDVCAADRGSLDRGGYGVGIQP